MKYAQLASIVNGFESAREWRFLRKGSQSWSLVGVDDKGDVSYEIEHLIYSQLLRLCSALDVDAPIEKIEDNDTTVRRETLVLVVQMALKSLTKDVEPAYRRTSIESLQTLLQELEPTDDTPTKG